MNLPSTSQCLRIVKKYLYDYFHQSALTIISYQLFTFRSLFTQQPFREGQILRAVSTQVMSVINIHYFPPCAYTKRFHFVIRVKGLIARLNKRILCCCLADV